MLESLILLAASGYFLRNIGNNTKILEELFSLLIRMVVKGIDSKTLDRDKTKNKNGEFKLMKTEYNKMNNYKHFDNNNKKSNLKSSDTDNIIANNYQICKLNIKNLKSKSISCKNKIDRPDKMKFS